MKNLIGLFLILFCFTSCQSTRISKLLTEGTLIERNFTKTIPFEYYRNWIIIKAKVNNSDKEYRFMVDTGAPNVISKNLAKALNLKSIAKDNVGSSTSAVQKSEFVQLNSIEIGGLHFQNTGAVVMGFDTSPDIKCLGSAVDGLIGSNLMRKAIWQIDYKNQTITITDQRKKLQHLDGYTVPFETTTQGTPQVKMKLPNDLTIKVGFDTGKSGNISTNSSHLKTIEKQTKVPKIAYHGEVASGIYGAQKDTAHITQILDFQLGDLKLDTALVAFRPKHKGLIGNGFLKHFIVTLDWNQEIITLKRAAVFQLFSTFKHFGFGYTLKDKQAYISLLFENSDIEKAGIKIGAKLKSINGQDLSNIDLHEYCDFQNNTLLGKAVQTATIVIKQDNKTQTLTLTRKDLFE